MSEKATSTILEAISVIFDRDDMDRNDKLIAIYLVRRGGLTGQAFPSFSTIAEECSVSTKTVQRSVAKMHGMGVVIAERKPGSRYVFTVIPGAESGHGDLTSGQGVHSEQPFGEDTTTAPPGHSVRTSGHGDLTPRTQCPQHPKETTKDKVKETSKGTEGRPPREPPLPADEGDDTEALVRLYGVYSPVSGRDIGRFTSRRYQEIQAALMAGATYEIIAQVIKDIGATATPWEIRKEAVRRAKGDQPGVHAGDARGRGGQAKGTRSGYEQTVEQYSNWIS